MTDPAFHRVDQHIIRGTPATFLCAPNSPLQHHPPASVVAVLGFFVVARFDVDDELVVLIYIRKASLALQRS